MSVSVCLQVEGVDLSQDATLEAIAVADLTAALWARVDDVVTATVYPESDEIAREVLRFARRVAARLPGARVLRVHRDLVSASDIAHRAGFSREAVRKWANGAADRAFPPPFAGVGDGQRSSKIWLWSDVAKWLIATYEFPIDVDWPDDRTIAHIEACLAKVPGYVSQEWEQITGSEAVLNIAPDFYVEVAKHRVTRPLPPDFFAKPIGEIGEINEVLSA